MTLIATDATVSNLQNMWMRLGDLVVIGEKLVLSFEWILNSNRTPIPFLDADVICGAVPALASSDAIQQSADDEGSSGASIIGPATVRYYLRNLGRFCIPYGSLLEVHRKNQALRRRLHEKARSVVDAERAIQSRSLSDALRQDRGRLTRELLDFAEGLDDKELLDELISRHTPVSSLNIAEEPGEEAERAYRVIHGELQRRRPSKFKKNANYCDALNVGSLVHVFNSKPRESEKILPLLISDTQPLLDSYPSVEKFLHWRDIPLHSTPQLFQDHTFLALFESIRHTADGGLPQLALDYAKTFRSDCNHLRKKCQEMRAILVQSQSDKKRDFVLRDFTRMSQSFATMWGRSLAPLDFAAEQDRASLRNRLAAKDAISRAGFKTDPAGVQANVRSLEKIKGSEKGASLWRLIEHYASLEQAIEVNTDSGQRELRDLLRISQAPSDGTPLVRTLLKQHEGKPRSEPAPRSREVRFVAHDPLGIGSPFIAVDGWTESGQDWFRIVWLHNKGLERIAKQGRLLLRRLSNCRASEPAKWRTFLPAGVLEVASRDLGADLPFDYISDIGFIDCTIGLCTFFADIVPFEDEERQAGLVVPGSKLNNSFLDELSKTLTHTSERYLDKTYWTTLIQRMLKRHGVSAESFLPSKELGAESPL